MHLSRVTYIPTSMGSNECNKSGFFSIFSGEKNPDFLCGKNGNKNPGNIHNKIQNEVRIFLKFLDGRS